jgi:BirA family biotin operon repressor/biotin-[acetyl-CoA-carboxylase] ligase
MNEADSQRVLAEVLTRGRFITRAEVLGECGSTQDVARERASPGLMILALSQTAGRGRLGRRWEATRGKGVAATFTLDARSHDAAHVSLVAGLAALQACAEALGRAKFDSGLGLRWPNDVVETGGAMRKVAGVLVERADDLLLVGIGINVLHEPSDWSDELAGRATSIAELLLDPDIEPEECDEPPTITEAAAMLARAFDHALQGTPADAAANWQRLNVLRNRTAIFEHDGRRYEGVVESIDPTAEIVLRLADGSRQRLPALSTSMVHNP